MIVVTAAGGLTGTAAVRSLRGQGRPVRALVGSRRPRPELDGLGAEVAVDARPGRSAVSVHDAAGDLR